MYVQFVLCIYVTLIFALTSLVGIAGRGAGVKPVQARAAGSGTTTSSWEWLRLSLRGGEPAPPMAVT